MTRYDVLVVGGGAAGLSAALALGRARRRVLVVDGGQPRNAPAAGVHNFLSRDGLPPGELLAAGRAEVRGYGGEIVSGTVASLEPGFTATLADGTTVGARAVIVTTGLVDELPAIDGLRERWGRDVLHCPYCHGHEVADTALGVLGSVHKALLVRQWSSDLTLFLDGAPDPTEREWEQLAARGISVVDGQVAGVVVEDDRLAGVRLADGTVVARTALFVSPFFRAADDLLTALGVETADLEFGGVPVATHVVADPSGRTSVPGVWAAGNVVDPMAQVVTAAAAGMAVGAQVNAHLVLDDTDRAVRGREAAVLERQVSEIVLGDRRHGLPLTPSASSSTT
ncbi:NAD(P)/FAD-dependent oxidoreductase [Pseudonocardia saturnea]